MRTALFVSKPTTVTIKAAVTADAKVVLERYAQRSAARPAIGSQPVEPGVYLIRSSAKLGISGDHVEVQLTTDDKDEFPEPPQALATLEAGATRKSLHDFFRKGSDGFQISKDLDVRD